MRNKNKLEKLRMRRTWWAFYVCNYKIFHGCFCLCLSQFSRMRTWHIQRLNSLRIMRKPCIRKTSEEALH